VVVVVVLVVLVIVVVVIVVVVVVVVVVVEVPQALWTSSPELLRKSAVRTGLSHIVLLECMLCCWRMRLCEVQSSIMC